MIEGAYGGNDLSQGAVQQSNFRKLQVDFADMLHDPRADLHQVVLNARARSGCTVLRQPGTRQESTEIAASASKARSMVSSCSRSGSCCRHGQYSRSSAMKRSRVS